MYTKVILSVEFLTHLFFFAVRENELGLAWFCPGKMGSRSMGMGFSHWEWIKRIKNGNGINICKP